jgi:hypothetical protein
MQIGGDGRRGRHGARQPELEGELRALRQGTHGHQQQCRQVERMGDDAIARGEHDVEVVAADDMADDEHPAEEAEATGRRDRERHPGAVTGILVMMPVGDEQEREKTRQLPEEHELNEIAGEDDASHRAHEGEQEREEARRRVGRRHIVARVEHHQKPDAEDKNREAPGKPVHTGDEVQPIVRQPWILRPDNLRIAHHWQE